MLRMVEPADSDEALMLRYAAGDVLAFETLYVRHELKVWRYILRSVGNQATADELLQDVWLAVSQAARRYQPTARFTTWIYTLAHHRVIDAYRRTRPVQSLDAANDGDEPLLERLAAEPDADPLHQVVALHDAQALLAALATLPLEQREAFLMQAEGELSVEEIAAATGVNFETAKSRLRYARARLRQKLQEQA